MASDLPTLVLADLHHNTAQADEILAAETWNRAVLLGDYFDNYGDCATDALHTALWVRDRLADPRCTLLFGNHDLPYAWPENPLIERPGFSDEKALAVSSVLTAEHWARLKLFAHVGPWLVAHAGFTLGLVPAATLIASPALSARCDLALSRVAAGEIDPLLLAGRDRGGSQHVGGVTWCDFRRLKPTAGIHQLVGHTPDARRPLRVTEGRDSLNFCLDHQNGRVFAVVDADRTAFKLWSRQGTETLRTVMHSTLSVLEGRTQTAEACIA